MTIIFTSNSPSQCVKRISSFIENERATIGALTKEKNGKYQIKITIAKGE